MWNDLEHAIGHIQWRLAVAEGQDIGDPAHREPTLADSMSIIG